MFTTLISSGQLASLIAAGSDLVLLDCRFRLADPGAGKKMYGEGHLPHAQYANLNDDLSGPTVSDQGRFMGRNPLPQREVLAQRFGQWGVHSNSQIVAYDDSDGVFAARLWWLARWLGHRHVAVLDGQMQAWLAEQGTLTTETCTKDPTLFHPAHALVRYVDTPEVARAAQDSHCVLLDARPADRYAGHNETLDARAGHIPGAVNRSFQLNVGTDGCFKGAASLRADFLQTGINPANTIVYCGSGGAACQTILAMKLAGLQGAALYPGSWSEWASDKDLPIAS